MSGPERRRPRVSSGGSGPSGLGSRSNVWAASQASNGRGDPDWRMDANPDNDSTDKNDNNELNNEFNDKERTVMGGGNNGTQGRRGAYAASKRNSSHRNGYQGGPEEIANLEMRQGDFFEEDADRDIQYRDEMYNEIDGLENHEDDEDDAGMPWTQVPENSGARRREDRGGLQMLLHDDDIQSIPTSVSPSVASSSVQSLFRRNAYSNYNGNSNYSGSNYNRSGKNYNNSGGSSSNNSGGRGSSVLSKKNSRLAQELSMSRNLDSRRLHDSWAHSSSSMGSSRPSLYSNSSQGFLQKSWGVLRGSKYPPSSGGTHGQSQTASTTTRSWSASVPTMILVGVISVYGVLSVFVNLGFRLLGIQLPMLLAPILLIVISGIILARPGTLASLLCTGINLVAQRAIGLNTRAEIGRIDLLRRRIDGMGIYWEDVSIVEIEEISLQFTSRAMHEFHGPTRPLLTLMVSGVHINMLHALVEAFLNSGAVSMSSKQQTGQQSPSSMDSTAGPSAGPGSPAPPSNLPSTNINSRGSAGQQGGSNSQATSEQQFLRHKQQKKLENQQKLFGRIVWISGFLVAEVDRVNLRFISSDVNFDLQAHNLLLSCSKRIVSGHKDSQKTERSSSGSRGIEIGGASMNTNPKAPDSSFAWTANELLTIAETRLTMGKFSIDVGCGLNATPIFNLDGLCIEAGVAHSSESGSHPVCACLSGSKQNVGNRASLPNGGFLIHNLSIGANEIDLLASHNLVAALRVVIGLQKKSHINHLPHDGGRNHFMPDASESATAPLDTQEDLATMSAERRIELSRKERLPGLRKSRTSSELSEDTAMSELSIDSAGWECERCRFYNQPLDLVCTVCKMPSDSDAANTESSEAHAGVAQAPKAKSRSATLEPQEFGASKKRPSNIQDKSRRPVPGTLAMDDFLQVHGDDNIEEDEKDEEEDEEDEEEEEDSPGSMSHKPKEAVRSAPEVILQSLLRKLPTLCEVQISTLLFAVQGERASQTIGGGAILHCQVQGQLAITQAKPPPGIYEESQKLVSRSIVLNSRIQHLTGAVLPCSFERIAANQISMRESRNFMLLPELRKHTFLQVRDIETRFTADINVTKGNRNDPSLKDTSTSPPKSTRGDDRSDISSDDIEGIDVSKRDSSSASEDNSDEEDETLNAGERGSLGTLNKEPGRAWSCPICNNRNTGSDQVCGLCQEPYDAVVVRPASWFDMSPISGGALKTAQNDHHHDTSIRVELHVRQPEVQASLTAFECLTNLKGALTQVDDDEDDEDDEDGNEYDDADELEPGTILHSGRGTTKGGETPKASQPAVVIGHGMAEDESTEIQPSKPVPKKSAFTPWMSEVIGVSFTRTVRLHFEVSEASCRVLPMTPVSSRKSVNMGTTISATQVTAELHKITFKIKLDHAIPPALAALALRNARNARKSGKPLTGQKHGVQVMFGASDISIGPMSIWQVFTAREAKYRANEVSQWSTQVPIGNVDLDESKRRSRLVHVSGPISTNVRLQWEKSASGPRLAAVKVLGSEPGVRINLHGASVLRILALVYDYSNEYLRCFKTQLQPTHVGRGNTNFPQHTRKENQPKGPRAAFASSTGPTASAIKQAQFLTALKTKLQVSITFKKLSVAVHAVDSLTNTRHAFRLSLPELSIDACGDKPIKLRLRKTTGSLATSTNTSSMGTYNPFFKCSKISLDIIFGKSEIANVPLTTLDMKMYLVQVTQGPDIQFGLALQALLRQRKALRQGLRDLAARRVILKSSSARSSPTNMSQHQPNSATSTYSPLTGVSSPTGYASGVNSVFAASFDPSKPLFVSPKVDTRKTVQQSSSAKKGSHRQIHIKLQVDELLLRFLHDEDSFVEDPRLEKYRPSKNSTAKSIPPYIGYICLEKTSIGLEWDSVEHSKEGLIDLVWAFDDCSSDTIPRAAHAHGFSFALGARIFQFDVSHSLFQLRNHKRPLAEAWSLSVARPCTIVLAELRGTSACISTVDVVLSEAFPGIFSHDVTLEPQTMLDSMSLHPYGVLFKDLPRAAVPLKTYYDVDLVCAQLNVAYGECLSATLRAFDVAFSRMLPKSSDKRSPRLGFWDKLRYLFHGLLNIHAKRASVRLLTLSPWHGDTGLLISGNDLQLRNLREIHEKPGSHLRKGRRGIDDSRKRLAKHQSNSRSMASDGSARDVMDWNSFFVPMSRHGSIRSRNHSTGSAGRDSFETATLNNSDTGTGDGNNMGQNVPIAREWEITSHQFVLSAIRNDRANKVLQTTLLTAPRTRLHVSFRWGQNSTLDHYVQLMHAPDARPWNIDDMYADFRSDGLDLGLKFEFGVAARVDHGGKHETPPGSPSVGLQYTGEVVSPPRLNPTPENRADDDDDDDDASDTLYPTVTLCWSSYPYLCEIRRAFAPLGPSRTPPEKATFARLLTRLRIGILADRPRVLWWEEPHSEAALFLAADSVVTRIEYIRPPDEGIDWAPPCGYPPKWKQHALLVQCSMVQSHFIPRAMPYLSMADSAILLEERTYVDATGCGWRFSNTFPPPPMATLEAMSSSSKDEDNPAQKLPASEPWVMTPAIMLTAGQWQQMQASMKTRESMTSQDSFYTFNDEDPGDDSVFTIRMDEVRLRWAMSIRDALFMVVGSVMFAFRLQSKVDERLREEAFLAADSQALLLLAKHKQKQLKGNLPSDDQVSTDSVIIRESSTSLQGDDNSSPEGQQDVEAAQRKAQFDGHFFGPLVDFEDAFAPEKPPSAFMADLLRRSDRTLNGRKYMAPTAYVEHWVHDEQSLRLEQETTGKDSGDDSSGKDVPGNAPNDVSEGNLFNDASGSFPDDDMGAQGHDDAQSATTSEAHGEEAGQLEFLVKLRWGQVFLRADSDAAFVTGEVATIRTFKSLMQCFERLTNTEMPGFEMIRKEVDVQVRGAQVFTLTSEHAEERRERCTPWVDLRRNYESLCFTDTLQDYAFCFHVDDEFRLGSEYESEDTIARTTSHHRRNVDTLGGSGKGKGSIDHRPALERMNFSIRELSYAIVPPESAAQAKQYSPSDARVPKGRFLLNLPSLNINLDSRSFFDILGVIRKLLLVMPSPDYTALLKKANVRDEKSHPSHSRGESGDWEDSFGDLDMDGDFEDSDSDLGQPIHKVQALLGDDFVDDDITPSDLDSLVEDASTTDSVDARPHGGAHSRSRSVELPSEKRRVHHKPTQSEVGVIGLDAGDLAAIQREAQHIRTGSKGSFSGRSSQMRRGQTFVGNISSRLRPRARANTGSAAASVTGSVGSHNSGRNRRESIIGGKQLLSEAEAELMSSNNSFGVLKKIIERLLGARTVEEKARESELVYSIGEANIYLVEDGNPPNSGGTQQRKDESQGGKVEFSRVMMQIFNLRGSHTFANDGSTRVQISLGDLRVSDIMQANCSFRDILRGYVVSSGSNDSSHVPLLRVDAKTQPHFIVGDYKVNVYEMLQVLIYPGAPSYRLAVHLTYDAATFFMRFFQSEADEDFSDDTALILAPTKVSSTETHSSSSDHKLGLQDDLTSIGTSGNPGGVPRSRGGSLSDEAVELALLAGPQDTGAPQPQRIIRSGYILKRGRNDISWAAGRVRRNFCQLKVVRTEGGDGHQVVLEYYRSELETRLRLPPRGTVYLKDVVVLDFSQDLGAPKHALDMIVQSSAAVSRGRADPDALARTITYTFSPDLSGRRNRTAHPNVASAEWIAAMRPFVRKNVLGDDITKVLKDESHRQTFDDITSHALKLFVSHAQRRAAAATVSAQRRENQSKALIEYGLARPDVRMASNEGIPLEMLRDSKQYELFLTQNRAKRYLLSKRRASAMGLLDSDTIRMHSGELVDLVYMKYMRTSGLYISVALQGFPYFGKLNNKRAECAAIKLHFRLFTWQKFFGFMRQRLTRSLIKSLMFTGAAGARNRERNMMREAAEQAGREALAKEFNEERAKAGAAVKASANAKAATSASSSHGGSSDRAASTGRKLPSRQQVKEIFTKKLSSGSKSPNSADATVGTNRSVTSPNSASSTSEPQHRRNLRISIGIKTPSISSTTATASSTRGPSSTHDCIEEESQIDSDDDPHHHLH